MERTMSGRKNKYPGDLGSAIRNKMREMDWRDSHPEEVDPEEDDAIQMDQEDEDWYEKMYQR